MSKPQPPQTDPQEKTKGSSNQRNGTPTSRPIHSFLAIQRAQSETQENPSTILPSDMPFLQRTIGNQAVAGLLERQKTSTTPTIQRDSTPKNVIQRKDRREVGERIGDIQHGLTANFVPNQGTPTSYSVTVAVARGMEDYVAFAKARMKSTIRNKARKGIRKVPGMKGLVRKEKDKAQIKNKAARQAITARNGAVTDEAVANILANSSSVGHAWIKFNVHGEDGSLLKTYSFGFIGAQPPQNPTQKVAGLVRNPDMEYEDKPNTRYHKTSISPKQYEQGIKRALKLQANPPQYSTAGYNCTKFTREVAKDAGAFFPPETAMIIPISTHNGLHLFEKAYNPNSLYDKLGDEEGTRENSVEKVLMQDTAFNPHGYNQQDAERQWTSDEVYNLIRMYRAVHDATSLAGWQSVGLTAEKLQILDDPDLRSLHQDRFRTAELFKTFGLQLIGPGGIPREFAALMRNQPMNQTQPTTGQTT